MTSLTCFRRTPRSHRRTGSCLGRSSTSTSKFSGAPCWFRGPDCAAVHRVPRTGIARCRSAPRVRPCPHPGPALERATGRPFSQAAPALRESAPERGRCIARPHDDPFDNFDWLMDTDEHHGYKSDVLLPVRRNQPVRWTLRHHVSRDAIAAAQAGRASSRSGYTAAMRRSTSRTGSRRSARGSRRPLVKRACPLRWARVRQHYLAGGRQPRGAWLSRRG